MLLAVNHLYIKKGGVANQVFKKLSNLRPISFQADEINLCRIVTEILRKKQRNVAYIGEFGDPCSMKMR